MTRNVLETLPPLHIVESVTNRQASSLLGRAATTLFITPAHDELHVDAELIAVKEKTEQPAQEDVYDACSQIWFIAQDAKLVDPHFSDARFLTAASTLIQFCDYVPDMTEFVRADKVQIEATHTAVIARAERIGPLSYADQFAVGMEINEGDLLNTLWGLFITSRLYARMLDTSIVSEYQGVTNEDRLDDMLAWRYSIASCKPLRGGVQDPAGDTYYTWTHALAGVLFGGDDTKRWNVYAKALFRNGTSVMHGLVHTVNKQSLKSDHRLAAHYGNRIAHVLSSIITRQSFDS